MNEAESRIWEIVRRYGTPTWYPNTVTDALKELAQVGDGKDSVFLQVLQHGNDDQRLLVLQLVREHQPSDTRFVTVLIGMLNEARLIKMTAIETLGHFGAIAIKAVPPIEKELDSEDGFHRCLSAGALLRIDPRHVRAIEVLETALRSDDEALQKHAEHYVTNSS